MNKFTIEDLRDIAYRGSYDDLERELALQLLVSMEQAPVYLRHFGDDGETFVACDGNDERAITLYAAPQLPQPEVPLPVSVVKGELGFINHLERIIGERDEDIDIGQLGCGNYDALMLAALDAFRAAMLQAGNSPVTLDGWIPVSERMPEASGRYWCYVEEQNCLGKSHYQWNCSWNGERWWVESDNGGRVTHWMELPASPKL